MPAGIGRQTVTILNAPLVTGDYNAQSRDWAQAVATVVTGCTVDYTASSESRQAQDQTTTRAQLFMPRRGPAVTEWCRIEWDGRTWDVDGVPGTPQEAGPLAGQVVSLLEVAG